MNKEEFKKELEKLGIKYEAVAEENLALYFNFLKEYNAHTNLTAITEEKDVYLKHFYDSLTVIKAVDLTNINSIIDLGSGAGFPGVVLKIFFPHLKLTLLDSNNKKTTFLKLLVEKLKLENVEVVNARAEDYAKNNNEKYDLCVSRAVAFIDIIAGVSLPLIKKEGRVILLKGNFQNEQLILEKHAKEIGISSYEIIGFTLPDNVSERNLVILKRLETLNLLNYSQLIKRNKKWTA